MAKTKKKSRSKPAKRKVPVKNKKVKPVKKEIKKMATKKTASRKKASVKPPVKRKKSRSVAVPVARRRRRRGSRIGSSSLTNTVKESLYTAAVGGSSAVVVTMGTARLPILSTRVKAFVPIVAGIATIMLSRKKYRRLGSVAGGGMLVAGGLAVIKQFVPQFALAGENEMLRNQIRKQKTSLLGRKMGVPTSYEMLGAPRSFAPNVEPLM
jgi:hypothetical protein